MGKDRCYSGGDEVEQQFDDLGNLYRVGRDNTGARVIEKYQRTNTIPLAEYKDAIGADGSDDISGTLQVAGLTPVTEI